MRKGKSKTKYDNLFLVIFFFLFVIFLIITLFLAKSVIKEMKGIKKADAEAIDKIEDYDYQLTSNHTDYFEETYYQLKELLESEKQENFEKEYASLVAKLFLCDFYDLNSKLDKTDVGGVQFVWQDYREDFKNYATDKKGIYYYVENNIYGDRKQSLPSVSEVKIESVKEIKYSKDGIIDNNAYQIKASISYEKDMGYPKKCTLTILHNQNKLEVIKME